MTFLSRRQKLQALQADGQHIAAVFPAFIRVNYCGRLDFTPLNYGAASAVSPAVAEHFQSYTCAIARAGVAFCGTSIS